MIKAKQWLGCLHVLLESLIWELLHAALEHSDGVLRLAHLRKQAAVGTQVLLILQCKPAEVSSTDTAWTHQIQFPLLTC